MQNVKKRKFETSLFPGTAIRKYYPDRSSMRPKLSTPQLAQVKRVIYSNKEKKHVFTVNNVAANYNGTITAVGMPAQGTNGGQRIGDEINNVRFKVIGNIQGVNLHTFRFIAFQWKSANGTAPVPADVITNGFLGGFNAVNGPYNEDSQKKMKILYDRTFALDPYNQVKTFNFDVKCLNIEMTGGSSTLGTNVIYTLLLQDGVVSLNTCYWSEELQFTDA